MEEDQTLSKWTRLSGEERSDFSSRCARLYEEYELTIRDIVERTGRSYGAVHRALHEAGVRMRPRGSRMHG